MYIKNIAITISSILEAFLTDYCEVNGIKESNLKDNISVVSFCKELTLMVTGCNNREDVKFRVQFLPLCGAYMIMGHNSSYSRTKSFLDSLDKVEYV